jgi:spore maturation protein CgeB
MIASISNAPPPRSILIAAGAMAPIYEPAILRALRENGHEAKLINAAPRAHPTLFERLQARLCWGPSIKRIREEVISAARSLKPDFLLIYQGHYFDRKTVEQLAALTTVVGIHNDDPFGTRKSMLRYRLLRPSLPAYHGFHVYRETNVREALALGAARVKVLMPYYIPWLDYPRDLQQDDLKEWQSDVVFVGHHEPDHRTECLSAAVREGARVKIFGPPRFWNAALAADVLRGVPPIRSLDAEDYRKAIAGAKICACFLSKWNRDHYTRRIFEIPACGGFLLSERTPYIESLFRDGETAAFFSTSEEFADKVRFYLAKDDLRRKIAAAGREIIVRGGHDVHARVRQWMDDVSEWRNEPPGGSRLSPSV